MQRGFRDARNDAGFAAPVRAGFFNSPTATGFPRTAFLFAGPSSAVAVGIEPAAQPLEGGVARILDADFFSIPRRCSQAQCRWVAGSAP